MSADRMARRFAALRAEGRAGLVVFLVAGDPDAETSLALLRGLPEAGADIIELGMPYPNPSKDGPVITAAAERARAAGGDLAATLDLARRFRESDGDTPLVLMGYFGSVTGHGVDSFARDAAGAGADGVLLGDFPPAMAPVLGARLAAAGLHLIRLADPESETADLVRSLDGASGFVYYATSTGVTGSTAATAGSVAGGVRRLRERTDLPVAVGFGIKSPGQVAGVGHFCDAVVVGSAFVNHIADNLDKSAPQGQYRAGEHLIPAALGFVRDLSAALRRQGPVKRD